MHATYKAWGRLGAVLVALGSIACSAKPTGQGKEVAHVGARFTASIVRAAAPVHALVELTERPAAAAYRSQLTRVGASDTSATAAGVAQLANVETEQALFADRVVTAHIPNTTEIFRLQRVYNGIVYVTDAAGLSKLRAVPGARAVHVLSTLEKDNAVGVPFVGVPQIWSLGVPLHGEGIRVGVIDTGIDYTHANFGGPGTAAAYAANDPNVVEPGTFPTAKVVGGLDFAGATYDASSAATAIPTPDDDPLDGDGHGSHVAGTIAGLGVNLDGTPYAGPYDLSLDPTTLRIGPGAAPAASLYALKVFGDHGGSTALAALAMEWATDPNGDGDFSDHLDVVNLSLGSAFGNSSDTDAAIYANAVKAGVVVVASAGNAADIYFVSGSPAATPSVISVAASSVGEYPAVRVDAPASVAGLKAAGTAAFGPVQFSVSGELVATVPVTACNGAAGSVTNGADLVGKIALIRRGTCSFALKAKAAADAGAIGVVIYNNVAGDPPGMANASPPVTVTVPTRSIGLADGTALAALLGGSTPQVVDVTLADTLGFVDPTLADTVASFSSRGPSRALNLPVLKPDLAAPGVNVVSTGMGTGYLGVTLSGTSMAAPLTTGTLALLRQAHPAWSPAQLKALAMNTAGHDLFNAATTVPTRLRESPLRQGAGRIDAQAADAASVIAYDVSAPERVSVSFATVDVAAATTEHRSLRLANLGLADVTYDVAVDPVVAPPGTAVTADAPAVTVTAGATADLGLTLAVDPAAMVRLRDPTVLAVNLGLPRNWLSEVSGYVVLVPEGGGPTLRVPYFGAPGPAAAMAAEGPLATAGATGAAGLALAGTGVDTTGLAAPPEGVISLVTPFELAYASLQRRETRSAS